jgi:CheY-like chemotaxis protein
MTSVVLFEVGTARYALPAAAVVTLADPAAHPVVSSISGLSVRYAGMLIPLIRLDELLGEQGNSAGRAEHGEQERLMIVSRGRELLALRGTYRHSEREVVLKSMGRFFARNRLISAVIPLADGSLALVLSVSELYVGPRTAPIKPAVADPNRRRTVLVVDDSPVVRDLLAEALRAHGLQVIEAGDGEDALQKMEICPPLDLIVTDIDMPKLDGIGLLRRLRRTDLPRRLPVVVVSMRGSMEDQKRALESGADAYLVKTDLSHAGLWTMLSRFLK